MLVNGALALEDVAPTGFAFWQQGSSLRSNHAGTVHRMTKNMHSSKVMDMYESVVVVATCC